VLLLDVPTVTEILRAAGGAAYMPARGVEGAAALLADARAKHASKIDGTTDILEVGELSAVQTCPFPWIDAEGPGRCSLWVMGSAGRIRPLRVEWGSRLISASPA
jgi:hypothetical protein